MDPDSLDGIDREPHGGTTARDVLDFSANTNPVTPPGVADVLDRAYEAARRYPEEPPEAYQRAAAEYVDVQPDQVIPTPGGLAAIRLALEVVLSPGDSALVPYPSFGEYGREVRLQGAEPEFVPYDELTAADLDPHELAIICNPNNPTGDAYDPAELESFVERARDAETTVLVDEAFLGFTDLPTLSGTDGVVVARSLTKLFGLPGLRAGFAVATGTLRDRMATARRTWNLGVPAMQAGIHSMRATDFVAETRDRVRREREQMAATLAERYEVHPSDSPFLLLGVQDESVDSHIRRARESGIVVRDARTFRGLDRHIRVAVKQAEANRRLEEVLLDV
jgi:L-threonine-O-3-phosphate decarboxylase